VQRPVKPESKLFITRKKSLMDSADELINETSSKRLIPINISIKWDENKFAHLDCEFPVTIPVTGTPKHEITHKHLHYRSPLQFETAIKRPLSHEQIEKQLKKTGGTPFIIKEIKMEYPGDLFVSIGKLNQLRRDLLDKVAEELLNYYIPEKKDLKAAETHFDNLLNGLKSDLKIKHKPESDKSTNFDYKPSKTVVGAYVDNLETLTVACKGGCKRVYFEPHSTYSNFKNSNPDEKYIERYFEDIFELLRKAGTICSEMKVDLIWKLPKITPQSYLDHTTALINKLSDLNVSGVMVDGIGAAEAIKTQNNKFEIYGSTGLNVWNHLTAKQLSKTSNDPSKNPGITFKSLTVSPELSKNEIKRLISTSHTKNIPTSFELLVQGNIESMVTEDCLPFINPKSNGLKIYDAKKEFIGIMDAKKRVFPVNTDYNGRTHVLNAVELCLVDYMPSILRMGIDSVVIDARGKTPSYALEMAAIYNKAVEKTGKGNELKKTLNMLKNNVKKISTGGITTGNFIRGVK
ncbi:MAG: DUF3656 domain-containing protein, partial [Methanobacterium paludis]|nr:DUF3656 domain-containing protein [Methanobacterium paludis]